MLRVRALEAFDRSQWEPQWQGYQTFYKVALPPEVTEAAWQRILDPAEPVEGYGAFDGETMLGFVHLIFYRETWSVADRVYLKDLFTVPEARGRGVGRALIAAAKARAKEKGADRVWWLTHEGNAPGRQLYDKVAVDTGFIQYRLDV